MNQALFLRIKNALNLQHYCMNDSWLADCIEYYLDEHNSPTQTEIITFVINQWMLCDLREINNENGCLPKNLTQQKCTTLRGKYILQMEKIYDISTSKYKQLEKIRNVSSDNIKTTEEENEIQEDKFQNWQATPKRMLQLFLTDGIQDVLAIEYKPIMSLNDNLFPGIKIMIKGPVMCRKGVILLEEVNISEVGGEVDSLLIPNALENVLARALHLEENPDPYNDFKKTVTKTQGGQNPNNTKTIAIEDDFEMDSQVIDQIERQIEEQTSNVSKISIPSKSNEQNQISKSKNNTKSFQKPLSFTNENQNLTHIPKNQQLNYNSNLNSSTNNMQQKSNKSNIQDKVTNFEIEDSFIDMFDDKIFETLPTSKTNTRSSISMKYTPSTSLRYSPSTSLRYSPPSTLTTHTLSTSTRHSLGKSTRHSPSKSIRHSPSKSSRHSPSKSTRHSPNTSIRHSPSTSIRYSPIKSTRHSPSKSTRHSPSKSTRHSPSTSTKHSTNNKCSPILSSKRSPIISSKRSPSIPISTSGTSTSGIKRQSTLKFIGTENENDFPMENEIYDLTEECSSFFRSSKSNETSKIPNLFNKKSADQNLLYKQNTSSRSEKSNQMDISPKNILKNSSSHDAYHGNANWKFPSPLQSKNKVKPTTAMSNFINFPDDDFPDDVNFNTDNYNDFFNKNTKTKFNDQKCDAISVNTSISNANKERSRILFNSSSTNSSDENQYESHTWQNIGNEFDDNFDFKFEDDKAIEKKLSNSQETDNITKSNKSEKNSINMSQDDTADISTAESTGNKRLANTPPAISAPEKIRCLENSPQPSCSSSKKISEFECNSPFINAHMPKIIELICEVLKQPLTYEAYKTTVRGKVINIVKLNLFKNENGPYFHLEATITDFTGSLDIVFSSKVLENLIGYTAQEFSVKRRQSKVDPEMKEHLRENLKKAQQTLRVMDALMDLELKKNEKILVLNVTEMTEDQKDFLNYKIKSLTQ